MSSIKITAAWMMGACVISARAAAVDINRLPPAAAGAGLTYAADIKPIFDGQCVNCHGREKQRAGLRLDTLEGAAKGGENGRVINPGNSAGSQLVWSVAHVGDADKFMPKGRGAKPLSAVQVGLIRAWIDQGAK